MTEKQGRPITVFISPNLDERNLRLFLMAKQASAESFNRAIKSLYTSIIENKMPLTLNGSKKVGPLLYYSKPPDNTTFVPEKRVWFPENLRSSVVPLPENTRSDEDVNEKSIVASGTDSRKGKRPSKLKRVCNSLLKPFRAVFKRPHTVTH